MSEASSISRRQTALDALEAIASDPNQPGSARAAAARTLLEYERALGPRAVEQADERPLHELSKGELVALAKRQMGVTPD